LLEACLLHRREIARHLAILILVDLEHLGPAGLDPIHQLPDAVGVCGDTRLHLILECPAPFHLLLHQRAPARAESLLCRAEFRRLVRRQIQLLLDVITEPLLDLPAETSRLGGVDLRARGVSLLRSERRRQQDGKAE